MQVLTAQQREGMKEAIKFNTELIKIFSIIAIALATGVLSLAVPASLSEVPVEYAIKVFITSGSSAFFIFLSFTIFLLFLNSKKIKTLNK